MFAKVNGKDVLCSTYSQVYQFGKLFQSYKAAAEDLFREDRVNGSLQGSQGADEK